MPPQGSASPGLFDHFFSLSERLELGFSLEFFWISFGLGIDVLLTSMPGHGLSLPG